MVVHLRSELIARGRDPGEIDAMVRSGALQPVGRGAYVAAGQHPLSEHDPRRQRAKIIAAARKSPQLVVSHLSAAFLHGLPLVAVGTPPVHLTRIAANGARRSKVREVHSALLSDDEVVVIDGLRVTSAARTLVDIGCWCPGGRTVVAAADAALHSRLVSPASLAEALDLARGRHGLGRARTRLRFADGRAESPGESVLRWVMVQYGLPAPELQLEVFTPMGRFVARVDLAYPEEGLVVEFDGLVKYRSLIPAGMTASEVVIAEKRREDELRGLGLGVVRVIWDDFRDERGLIARVHAARNRGSTQQARAAVTARWMVRPAVRVS